MIKQSKNSNETDLGTGLFSSVQEHTHNHNQHPGIGNTNAVKPILKGKPPFQEVRTGSYKVAKVETISNMDSQDETEILSRIIQYEQEIGRQPTMLNLLSRFSQKEIVIVWQDLLWLYPSLGETEWSSTACPDLKQVVV